MSGVRGTRRIDAPSSCGYSERNRESQTGERDDSAVPNPSIDWKRVALSTVMLTGWGVWPHPGTAASRTQATTTTRTISVEGGILLSATPDGRARMGLGDFWSRNHIL